MLGRSGLAEIKLLLLLIQIQKSRVPLTCKFYEIIFEVNLTLTTSFLPLVCSSRGALNGVDGAASSPNIDAKYSCEMDC